MNTKFHNILNDYLDKLESSRTTYPILLKRLIDEFEILHNDYESFIDKFLQPYNNKKEFFLKFKWTSINSYNILDMHKQYLNINLPNEDNEYIIPLNKIKEHRKYEKKISHLDIALHSISGNYLVSYVSCFDSFLGNLMKEIFTLKAELLNNSDRELLFKDLIEFDSIEEAREFILEKEINSLLRKSHLEQFNWMENKFNLTLRKGLDLWEDFIEITERRNLIVHNDGVVSNQYLKICNENKIKSNDVSIGDTLTVSPKYLNNVHNIFYELGFKLVNVLWRKLFPNDLEEADNSLIDITYELLTQKRYKLVIKLLDFAKTTIKKYNNEVNERMIVINSAIAYKFSNHEKESLDIINKYDWSATRPDFQLAVSVLKDEDQNVYSQMKHLGKDYPYLHELSYVEWPLFEKFRSKKEFQEVYKEIFDKEIELREVIDH